MKIHCAYVNISGKYSITYGLGIGPYGFVILRLKLTVLGILLCQNSSLLNFSELSFVAYQSFDIQELPNFIKQYFVRLLCVCDSEHFFMPVF